jgi:hypothetical protein
MLTMLGNLLLLAGQIESVISMPFADTFFLFDINKKEPCAQKTNNLFSKTRMFFELLREIFIKEGKDFFISVLRRKNKYDI